MANTQREALITMSSPELDRLDLMVRIKEKRLTQDEAARILGITLRQVERIYRRFREQGPEGLVSRKRGRPSNRKLTDKYRESVLSLVRDRYHDFGPTFACEKLIEKHKLKVSRETLRSWMIEAELWVPRRQRKKVYQPRNRRACFGELIQIDGSDHEWFEDRAPRCTLLVFVDDATSQLTELRFVETESAFDYMASTRRHVERYGKPVAFYSDRHSVFHVANKQANGGSGVTQFGRALSELNIDIICANSSQAKGRVERANLTLQDRLVKEMRLANVCDRDAGNQFLEQFRLDYNQRFGKPPGSTHDAHRPLRPGDDMDRIFTWQVTRKVSMNLTLRYERALYLLSPGRRELIGHRIDVAEDEAGNVTLHFKGQPIEYVVHEKDCHVQQGATVGNKHLGAVLRHIQEEQKTRDAELLTKNYITKRQKERLRQRARAAILH